MKRNTNTCRLTSRAPRRTNQCSQDATTATTDIMPGVKTYLHNYQSSSSPNDSSLALLSLASLARLAFFLEPLPPSFPSLPAPAPNAPATGRLLNFNLPEASVYSMGSSGGGGGLLAPAAEPPDSLPPLAFGPWFYASSVGRAAISGGGEKD